MVPPGIQTFALGVWSVPSLDNSLRVGLKMPCWRGATNGCMYFVPGTHAPRVGPVAWQRRQIEAGQQADDDHGNCTKWLTDRFYPEQDFRAWVTTFNFIMASSLFHDVLTPQQ